MQAKLHSLKEIDLTHQTAYKLERLAEFRKLIDEAVEEAMADSELCTRQRVLNKVADALRPPPVDPPPLPKDKFRIIYADPPWKYEFAQFQDLRIRYPTLTVEQIIDYEVDGKLLKSEYFDKDAVLFLWAAPPKLVEALTVLFNTQNTSSSVTNRLSKKDTINENKSLPVQANHTLREKTTVLPVLGLSRSAIFSCRASSHCGG